MAFFLDWLVNRNTATLLRLRLLESAQFFNPNDYNPLFDSQLGELCNRTSDPDLQKQVSALRGFDWANYIVRSVRSSFRDDDSVQEHFHSIVVRLLVSPGRLFKGWEPHRHGPLERRFRRSVWNAIRNIADKSRNRRKWMTSADPAVMAGQYAERQPNSDVVDEFRQLVAKRLGKLALAILDARLAGEDTKKMVGKNEFGTPSAFYIKREVSAIKQLARSFGDPAFSSMVNRAFASEAATIAKRKSAVAAKKAV